MKSTLFIGLLLFTSLGHATELTPINIVGQYKVEAHALFKHFYGNVKIIGAGDFEFRRTYPDGKKDPWCQGTYQFSTSQKTFQGVGTCPDDRQKQLDFRMEFGTTTLEDLERGTTVKIQSSYSNGLKVNAHVKKQ